MHFVAFSYITALSAREATIKHVGATFVRVYLVSPPDLGVPTGLHLTVEVLSVSARCTNLLTLKRFVLISIGKSRGSRRWQLVGKDFFLDDGAFVA